MEQLMYGMLLVQLVVSDKIIFNVSYGVVFQSVTPDITQTEVPV